MDKLRMGFGLVLSMRRRCASYRVVTELGERQSDCVHRSCQRAKVEQEEEKVRILQFLEEARK